MVSAGPGLVPRITDEAQKKKDTHTHTHSIGSFMTTFLLRPLDISSFLRLVFSSVRFSELL